jgi:conjugal transfer mating pair stabilization protein TraN
MRRQDRLRSSKRLSGLSPFPVLAGFCLLLSSTSLSAQTLDAKAAAQALASQLQGQVSSAATSQNAASAVPGFGGADLPQGTYLASPDKLASDGAIQAVTSQPYAIVTNPNRATVDASTLGLANAKQIESNPTAFSGIGAGGTQGNCQALPANSGTSSVYYDSCQIGQAENDTSFTCKTGWVDAFTHLHRYTCHTSQWDIHNLDAGNTFYWGEVSDCGSFASQSTCTQVAKLAQPTTSSFPPGTAFEMRFTQSDTTYDCSGQTNFGTGASTNYCLMHSSLCGTPPPQDQAPGVAGATYVGPVEIYQGSSIDNSDCQTKLGAAAGMTCTQQSQTCSDTSPTTRMVGGTAVTHDCWQWQASYQCSTLSSANDCATLSAKNNCSFDHEVCLDDPQSGACRVTSEVYKCTTPVGPETSQAYFCSGDVYCIDGSCTQLPRSASPDLAKTLVAMNAMKEADQQFDAKSLTIFDGESAGCHKPLFSLVNCCAGKVSGLLTGATAATAMLGLASGNYAMVLGLTTQFLPLFMCGSEEIRLDVKDRMGLCHYVGEYCSEKALFVCTTMRKSYCCYRSKLARVIQEQGRAQLGLDFGNPQAPACTGFTVEQFSRLDLSKMDFAEVFADFTSAVSLPASLQTSAAIQQKVEAYYQTHGQGS